MIQTIFSSTAPWPSNKTMRDLAPRKRVFVYQRGPKMSAEQVVEIHTKLEAGVMKKTICEDYEISYETLQCIVRKEGAYK